MILQPATPKSGADPGGAPGALPPKIGKDVIFLRKMVIFHTKYPKYFRASLRSAQFFKVRPPPNLKSWIRPWKCVNL
jgi:hypothetical protein